MSRDEYNAKVQELMAMWGDSCRVRPGYGVGSKLLASYFEVYWDGQWRQLGVQFDPFTWNTRYEWNETTELRLRGEFAKALIHS